jgi:hypothetical protein
MLKAILFLVMIFGLSQVNGNSVGGEGCPNCLSNCDCAGACPKCTNNCTCGKGAAPANSN